MQAIETFEIPVCFEISLCVRQNETCPPLARIELVSVSRNITCFRQLEQNLLVVWGQSEQNLFPLARIELVSVSRNRTCQLFGVSQNRICLAPEQNSKVAMQFGYKELRRGEYKQHAASLYNIFLSGYIYIYIYLYIYRYIYIYIYIQYML